MCKKIAMAFAMLVFVVTAGANAAQAKKLTVESVKRASEQNVELLLQEIISLKEQKNKSAKSDIMSQLNLNLGIHDDDCDPDEDDEVSCASNCVGRYSDGSCYSYGSDYCGRDAACAARCVGRYSDGNCYSYSSDFCGPDATCIENCQGRYSDGTCYSYGPDMCY